ncbi:MAG: protein phosphatase 2C domain-containing protein [archaeon]|nr:protein phosphatase 2C domain-containing protein [archaeon]
MRKLNNPKTTSHRSISNPRLGGTMRKIDIFPNKYSKKKLLSSEQDNSLDGQIIKGTKITPILPNALKENSPHPKKMIKSSSTGKLPLVGTTKSNKKQNYWGIPINININNNIFNNINYIDYLKEEQSPGNLFRNRVKSIRNQFKQSPSSNDISAGNISTGNKKLNYTHIIKDPLKLKKTKTVEDESVDSLAPTPIILPNTGKNAINNKNNLPNINNEENNPFTTKAQGNSKGYFENSLNNLKRFEALVKKGNKLKINKNPKPVYNILNNVPNQIFPKQPIPIIRNKVNQSPSPKRENNSLIDNSPKKENLLNDNDNLKDTGTGSNNIKGGSPSKNENKSLIQKFTQQDKVKKSHLRKTSEVIECGSYRDKVLNNNPQPNGDKNEEVKFYNFCTKAGKDDEGKTKTNQDSYLINYKINGIDNFHMFGILDGHGAIGHFASRTSTNFIKNYVNNDKLITRLKTTDEIYKQLKNDKYAYITSLFRKTELELMLGEKDFSFSGTTCVIIFIIGKKIICANAGDSRAIMISKSKDNKYSVKALSRDHKPEIETERKRIEAKGGALERYVIDGEEIGPIRVWVKGEGYPGLAMSRSIGDLVASQVGVTPDPEIFEYDLEEDNKYIVLATDGIWDYLPNEKVMEIGEEYYEEGQCEEYCKTLVKEAAKCWDEHEFVRDDITCISVFF